MYIYFNMLCLYKMHMQYTLKKVNKICVFFKKLEINTIK